MWDVIFLIIALVVASYFLICTLKDSKIWNVYVEAKVKNDVKTMKAAQSAMKSGCFKILKFKVRR